MRICEVGAMTIFMKSAMHAKGKGRERSGRAVRRHLLHDLASLLLVAMLGWVGGLTPRSAEATTDTYYFQHAASSSVCDGTSTANQSAAANVLPGGSIAGSTDYQTGGWYHFNWDAGATTGATSLANDMYTAPFNSSTKITALTLRMNYVYTYGSPQNYTPPANMYAKFYDVDGNAPCPGFEQGTLIAQTPESTWLLFSGSITASGIYYVIQPGHRIRVELWNLFAPGKTLQVNYGPGTTTGLDVQYIPPPPDPPPFPNTTVRPGAALPSVTLAPGGASAILHNFTVQTSSGTDRIDSVTVAISPYGASSLIGNLAIWNNAGTSYYGSVNNPTSDLVTIPLYYSIYPTTTPTQYRVVVTPKSHTTMPVPPGTSYTFTGTVEGLVSMAVPPYTELYYDAATNTVTIDNTSPATPVWGALSAGDSTVNLNWTNPTNADFQSVVILRDTAAITVSPAEGSSYTSGNTIGSSKVVYAGNLQTFIDGLADPIWNGTPYYYRIFARDASGNYSPGAAAGPFTPLQNGTGAVVVGDGTNPANNRIGIVPNDVAAGLVELDAFTLTSWPPSHLTSVTVTFPPGTGRYTSQVYLYDATDRVIRNTTPTSDSVVLGSLNIPITNAVSSFKIKVDQHHITLPPANTETPFTAGITAVTVDNPDMTFAYNDSASATVTIDHKAPANPTLQNITGADGRVDMRWTDPADSDTYGTMILRNTVPITDAPQDGYSYSYYTGMIGTSQLIHNSTSYTPLSQETRSDYVTNGGTYYYKIFARDGRHNYSTGLSVGPVTPDVTVTVGNGTDPANTVIAPGSGAASVDAFTLASTSSASVNGVTVTLSPGALDVVGSVRIASGDGATVYGSVASPASETVTIPTTGLSAITTPTARRIEIIPKTHAGMPAVPGAEVAVTGRVTAVTTAATSYKVYNDTSGATLTVDNLSPGNPAGAAALPLDGGMYVSWTNPADADFSSVLVLRDTKQVADLPVEGVSYAAGMTIGTSTVAYAGSLQSFIERGLINGAGYHYRLFALDSHGNYSLTGTPIGPLAPLSNNRTVAGSTTAIIQGLDAIAVTMPFTDDANGNGTCAVEYKLSAASGWTPWLNGISRSAASCTTTITGLTAGSLYDVRMSFSDSDGVLGTASQTVTSIVALSLIQTSVGVAGAAFTDSWIITVTTPFTNDYNHNNSCLIEYKKSSNNDWTTWGTLGSGDSPYVALIYGLQEMTRYDVRVTYSDPDGVNGASVQTLTGLFSPSSPNHKLMHNSLNANKKGYWPEYGGWGLPGTQYGEFTCLTCHTKRTPNASGIRTNIVLSPLPGSINFGGEVRFDGTIGSFGDDSVARPVPPPTNRICEVCHTLTKGGALQTPEHRKIQPQTANHNGQECTRCHKHENGFKSPF
jgi:hypothetical protein